MTSPARDEQLPAAMIAAGAQAIRICNPVGASETAECVIENAIEAVGGIVSVAAAEAGLAALREAAQAVVGRFDGWNFTYDHPIVRLRAVLASADGESREDA